MNLKWHNKDNLDYPWFLAAFLAIMAARHSLTPSLELEIVLAFVVLITAGFFHGLEDFMKVKCLISRRSGSEFGTTSVGITLYLMLCLIYFALWLVYPPAFLALFLIISISHFIAVEQDHTDGKLWLAAATGSMPIVLTSISHWSTVNPIYETIAPGWTAMSALIDIGLMQTVAAFIYLVPAILLLYQWMKTKSSSCAYNLICYLAYFIAFSLISPLLSFSLYFVLRHVPLQTIYASTEKIRDKIDSNSSSSLALNRKSVLVLTIGLSWILLLAIVLSQTRYDLHLDQLVLRTTFICLACLTLPHNLLDVIYRKSRPA